MPRGDYIYEFVLEAPKYLYMVGAILALVVLGYTGVQKVLIPWDRELARDTLERFGPTVIEKVGPDKYNVALRDVVRRLGISPETALSDTLSKIEQENGCTVEGVSPPGRGGFREVICR